MTKRYGAVVALRGVDLEVAAGEVVALLGPNGAGKTSLVSIVAGLRRADSGEVRVDGIDVRAHPHAARRRLGLAPQDTGIYPTLTVRDNLRFFGELAGLRRRDLARRIAAAAETLELGALLDRHARTLSGGERRRLHAAMILVHEPPLLLLDEPTTGVDVRTRSRLLDAVRDLAAGGAGVCYSTHYLAEVEQLDATVAILDAGRLVACGPLPALVAEHGEAAVELHFTGPAPRPPTGREGEVTGSILRVPTTRPPAVEAAALLPQLGGAIDRLRAVQLIQPSLESVFLTLTGRRYGDDDDDDDGALG